MTEAVNLTELMDTLLELRDVREAIDLCLRDTLARPRIAFVGGSGDPYKAPLVRIGKDEALPLLGARERYLSTKLKRLGVDAGPSAIKR